MEETNSRMAGSSFGSLKTVTEMQEIAALAGRPARQRTTTYGPVSPERAGAALCFDRLSRQLLPMVPATT
jgi:FO synthase